MAKLDSIFKPVGTFEGVTYVNSRRYGYHMRRKRFANKPAVMNEACQKQSEKLVNANAPAKIIKDAIDPYRQDFKDGSMWSRLVSRVQEHYDTGSPFDFNKIVPFEIHNDYRLNRLVHVIAKSAVSEDKTKLHVSISNNSHPNFGKRTEADGYRMTVIAIFPDLEKKSAVTRSVTSDIIDLTAPVVPVDVELPVPEGVNTYLICVRLEGSWKGKAVGLMRAMGMSVVEGGKGLRGRLKAMSKMQVERQFKCR